MQRDKGLHRKLVVLVTGEQHARLAALADQRGESIGQVVREAIEKYARGNAVA